jgi:hypothetical protein
VDEKKLNHAVLALQNGFGPALLLRMVKGTPECNVCERTM